MWAYADQGSYKMALRRCLKNYDTAKERALKLQQINSEKFSDEKLFDGFVKQIYEFEDPDAWLNELEDIVKEYE